VAERNVLVTGASGCIGANCVGRLLNLEKVDKVVAFSRKITPDALALVLGSEPRPNLCCMQGDVTDAEQLRRLLAEQRITHILHAAGIQTPGCQANPEFGISVNIMGTVAVYEAARQFGKIERIVAISSAAVTAPPEMYPRPFVVETDATYADTIYSATKIAVEALAAAYWRSFGVSSVVTRPYITYGPGRDEGMTSGPTMAIKCVALDREFKIPFTGTYDFSFVDDVGAAHVIPLLRPFKEGFGVYHIPGHPVSVEHFCHVLRHVAEELGVGAQYKIAIGTEKLTTPSDLCSHALRKVFREVPNTSLHDGIAASLRRFLELRKEGKLKA